MVESTHSPELKEKEEYHSHTGPLVATIGTRHPKILQEPESTPDSHRRKVKHHVKDQLVQLIERLARKKPAPKGCGDI